MKIKGKIKDIVATFPVTGKFKVIQSGFNFVVDDIDKVCISFYYPESEGKLNKAVLGAHVVRFKSGDESVAISNILTTLVLAPTKEERAARKVIEFDQDKGTQACIDHILRKRAAIEGIYGKEANRILLTLSALADELKQYL